MVITGKKEVDVEISEKQQLEITILTLRQQFGIDPGYYIKNGHVMYDTRNGPFTEEVTVRAANGVDEAALLVIRTLMEKR